MTQLLGLPWVACELIGSAIQIKANVTKHSVVGLSTDRVLWSLLSPLFSLLAVISHSASHTIRQEWQVRYPLRLPYHTDWVIVLWHVISLTTGATLAGVYFRFRRTASVFQGLSALSVITVALSLFPVELAVCGVYGMNALDVAEFLQLAGDVAYCVRFLPQAVITCAIQAPGTVAFKSIMWHLVAILWLCITQLSTSNPVLDASREPEIAAEVRVGFFTPLFFGSYVALNGVALIYLAVQTRKPRKSPYIREAQQALKDGDILEFSELAPLSGTVEV